MLNHPSKRYILYLMSKRRYSALDIVARLEDLDLPVPARKGSSLLHLKDNESRQEQENRINLKGPTDRDLFVQQIRDTYEELEFPEDFTPRDPDHIPSLNWLLSLGIQGRWHGDPSVIQAEALLADPTVSRMLKVMLLGPVSFVAVAQRLRNRFGLLVDEMNPRVVRSFAHYFWDYDAVDQQQWKTILRDWIPEQTPDMEMAVSAPRTPVGAALAITMADHGVSDSLREVMMYRHMRDTSFMEYVKASVGLYPGMKKSVAMLQLTDAVIKAQDQLDQRRGSSVELIEELQRLEASYDHSKLTTHKELPLDRVPDVIEAEIVGAKEDD